jgi:4-amino-4-deoxy-L-arabinose transferase-like glycosyltransferase
MLLVTLYSRYFFPLDETRYMSVAWNMWLRGDFLVPYLNDAPYSHKPPLLFWLIHLGWAVFGVNDWWPRLIPYFFSLGALWITQRIALLLWPAQNRLAHMAGLILFGSALWTLYATALMFDMLVAFFTVLGIWGLLQAWQSELKRGWITLTIAIAGGLLAKGPAILLQILPVAVLAPWWMQQQRPAWRAWYLRLLAATLAGIALLLLWAIPAGLAGGAQYQHDIFWGQTANRMVQSFAHRLPSWWYLEVLPLMVFPWLFVLPAWRGVWALRQAPAETGVRFCIAWAVPVFIAFSLISGKQVHYLLPIFPAFALLLARGFNNVNAIQRKDKGLLLAIGVSTGAALFAFTWFATQHHMTSWAQHISIWAGLALVVLSGLLFVYKSTDSYSLVWRGCLLSAGIIATLLLGVVAQTGDAYDLRRISQVIKQLQEQHIAVSHMGKYHGQFNFIGRLQQAPEAIYPFDMDKWFAAHRQGMAIVSIKHDETLGDIKPYYLSYYRAGRIMLVDAQDWQRWTKLNIPVPTLENPINDE